MVMCPRKKSLCKCPSSFPVAHTVFLGISRDVWLLEITNMLSFKCHLCCFRYENKYVKFFKSKPDVPPGLNPSDVAPQQQQQQQQQKIPGCGDGEAAGLSKSAKRNMKRKEKRKQQQQQGQDGDAEADVESVSNAVENVSISDGDKSANKTAAPVSAASTCDSSAAAAEKTKKIKNVRKKLRQVEELQQKVDSGEIKQPTKDQLEKLGRAKALQEELEQLELDS